MGCADLVFELYGVPQFFADVDQSRIYWREGRSVVHTVLEWVTTVVFDEYFSQFTNWPYETAQDFRARPLTRIFRSKQT